MKKFSFLLFLFLASVFYGQNENEGQSIELPEFVITGKRSLKMQKIKKQKPKFKSIIDSKFLLPQISNDSFSIEGANKPFEVIDKLFPNTNYYNGQLKVGLGIETMPVGEFNLNLPSRSSIVFANVKGINTKDYVDYSSYNKTSIGAGVKWFNKNSASAFSGLNVSLKGNYAKSSYNFFGSINPSKKRDVEVINAQVNFSNKQSKNVNYDIAIDFNNLKLKENNFGEFSGRADANFELLFQTFKINLDGIFNKQKVDILALDANAYSGRASLEYEVNKSFSLGGGFYYSKFEDENLSAPLGFIKLVFSKKLSMRAEFSPYANYESFSGLLLQNRYLDPSVNANSYEKYKSSIKAVVQYQFGRYFEITGGANYAKVDNYKYFVESIFNHFYQLNESNDVEVISGFVNFLFHKGPYGMFYADASFNSSKFAGGKFVPYQPVLNGSISYTYFLSSRITLNPKLSYISKSYSDVTNLNEVPAYIDLGFYASYKIFNGLEITADVTNILNNKNYRWNNYKEKPFDIVAGINYTW